jgi:uncharacterized damage-inducible protein DinB
MKSHIERMLRAMTWADRQSLEALRGCPTAHAEALPLFAHTLAAEHVWIARLRKSEPTIAVWPTLSIEDCDRIAAQNAAEYASFVGGLGEDGLAKTITYRNTKGDEFANTVIDILTHVVIHGAYHRGQIAKVLGRNGVSAVTTDYIIFARTIEPAGG